MKQETAVLDAASQDNTCLTPEEQAASRTGTRNTSAGTSQGPVATEKRNFGNRVKGLFVSLGRAIERAMDRNREFDHW